MNTFAAAAVKGFCFGRRLIYHHSPRSWPAVLLVQNGDHVNWEQPCCSDLLKGKGDNGYSSSLKGGIGFLEALAAVAVSILHPHGHDVR